MKLCVQAVERHFGELQVLRGVDLDVAFCPERIAEGRAMTELRELPQIVAARNERELERATKFLRALTDDFV